MDLQLSGKAFIVTGASSGIGAATARALGAEGAAVLLVARRDERLRAAAASCAGETATLALDVTEAGAAERIVAACTDRFGRLDGLVNNAGGARVIEPDELTEEDWQEQMAVNVMAPMYLIRAAAPLMAAAGWGRIVNVCSSSSRLPELGNLAYSVSKAAELSLSRAAATQWASRQVLVNAITPGVVETPAWTGPDGAAEQLSRESGKSVAEVLDEVRAEVPTGRLGSEEEVAAVIALLCSELAANVTGAAWAIDGGFVPTMT